MVEGVRAVKVTGAGMGGYVLVVSDLDAPPIDLQMPILRTKLDARGLIVSKM